MIASDVIGKAVRPDMHHHDPTLAVVSASASIGGYAAMGDRTRGRDPAVWKKLVDLRGGVRVDADQHVAQVRERIDVVKVAGRDQRVQSGEVVSALGVADE
jgi:hypothetical protein